jgi:hypothetical protein
MGIGNWLSLRDASPTLCASKYPLPNTQYLSPLGFSPPMRKIASRFST